MSGQLPLRMVGQGNVIKQVSQMLDRYSQTRHGFLCVVRGESGMGKSLLIDEVPSLKSLSKFS